MGHSKRAALIVKCELWPNHVTQYHVKEDCHSQFERGLNIWKWVDRQGLKTGLLILILYTDVLLTFNIFERVHLLLPWQYESIVFS